MRLARWLFGGAVLVTTACGVVFSPGDYRVGGDAGLPADGGFVSDAPSVSDAAAGLHFLIASGVRPTLDGEAPNNSSVAETIKTSIIETGQLGPWSYDTPPNVPAGWYSAKLVDGHVLVQTGPYIDRATFTDHITSEWTLFSPHGGQPDNTFIGWVDKGFVSAGAVVDGGITGTILFAPIDYDDGGVLPFKGVPGTQLLTPRLNAEIVRSGDFVYAVGGRESLDGETPSSDKVEMARLDADGKPGAFVATESMKNATTGTPHGMAYGRVIAGGGQMFASGGLTTGQASSITDIVIASKIDPGNGTLGAWTMLPRLPAGLRNHGIVYGGNTLFIFGGETLQGLSDAVLALDVKPDGTFGTEWKRIGTLPNGPRSWLGVMVY